MNNGYITYDQYIDDTISYAWIGEDIEEKRGDQLEDEKGLIVLISDIDDTEGVLAEHINLNGEDSNYLRYALINIDNGYYFFDAKSHAMELKTLSVDNKFICPYCKEDLCIVSGHEKIINNKKVTIDSFLRHYVKDEKDTYCIFHNSKLGEEKKYKLYSKEGIKHKKLKLKLIKEASKLNFKLPKYYKLITDLKTYKCRVEFPEFITKKVINVETEKRVLKKDNLTKGYVPDLILYTEDGDEIYVEVTVSSGKMVSEYYNIWNRLGKTVIECKLQDEEIIFKYLYNPIRDKARKEIIMTAKVLADKKIDREILNKILEIKDNIKKEYNMTTKKIEGNWRLLTCRGKICEDIWKHIVHNGKIYNRKEPEVVWKKLKESGFDVREGYKEIRKI